jgi:chorismate synthase
MAGTTIGQIFRLTTFGESHGDATGGVIDGCPAGLKIDIDFIQKELTRRKTGQSFFSSQRKEDENIVFISGVFEGKTTGTPLAFIIKNSDAKSDDYELLKNIFRPSHADFTYEEKYGLRDYRGGGRASARETVARVVAGAIAKILLMHYKIAITGYVSQIGNISLDADFKKFDLSFIEKNPVRCPDKKKSIKMVQFLETIKKEKDTAGGVINCIISSCPPGLGEPVFDKLQADLAKAMLSIPSVKGFEYGSGFHASVLKGSENNDIFELGKDKKVKTKTNRSGGIQGGISNGEDIFFRVAFKPIPSVMQKQNTLDKNRKKVTLEIKGRHDVCIVPRAVPVVEAMAAIVIADHLLRNKTARI